MKKISLKMRERDFIPYPFEVNKTQKIEEFQKK